MWRPFAKIATAFRSVYANGTKHLSLDRWPDNAGNYDPQNCRWATPRQQNRHRRSNLMLTAFGESKLAADWLIDPRCAVSKSRLHSRINCLGWAHEEAISTPPRPLADAKAKKYEPCSVCNPPR